MKNSEKLVLNVNGTGILDLDKQREANTDNGTLFITKLLQKCTKTLFHN